MENESTTVPLHHPDAFEMTSFIVQGLIVSVAISVFLETLARDYVAVIIPGDIGYFTLVTVFAP